MDWLFNPMYSAWLLVRDKRKWTRFTTAISASAGLVCGVLFTIMILASSPLTIASSDLAFGLVASVAFVPIAAVCWYMGICKPWTTTANQQVDDQQPIQGQFPD
jgi:hypothetical protein